MPMITTPALHRRLAALALLGATTWWQAAPA